MLPSLTPGKVVIILTKYYKLKTGDVVIFRHDNIEKIKRITKLAPNSLTVAGDNPTKSTDSRHFGEIPRTNVIGKVIFPRVNRN